MLSIQAVRGLPRLRAPGIVPRIISFSRQLPGSGQQETAATRPNAHLSLCPVLLATSADESVAAAVAPAVGQHCAGNLPTVLATTDAQPSYVYRYTQMSPSKQYQIKPGFLLLLLSKSVFTFSFSVLHFSCWFRAVD